MTWERKNERIARLRDVAKEQRKNPTPAESKFWSMVRKRRFHGYKFRRQVVLDPYVVDFYCRELGLVVELHGVLHSDQRRRDDARCEALQRTHDVRVFRFSNRKVLESPGIVWRILECAFGLHNRD